MKVSARRFWIGLVLVLTVAASVAVGDPSPELPLAEPVIRTAHLGAANEASSLKQGSPVRLSPLQRPIMAPAEVNPFAPKSWYVVPPPLPTQNVKPIAPAMPFSYKGKLDEGDGRQLFYLAKGDESFVIAVGDTFGGSYQLESARADALVIRYLPLSITQTLRYGPEL